MLSCPCPSLHSIKNSTMTQWVAVTVVWNFFVVSPLGLSDFCFSDIDGRYNVGNFLVTTGTMHSVLCSRLNLREVLSPISTHTHHGFMERNCKTKAAVAVRIHPGRMAPNGKAIRFRRLAPVHLRQRGSYTSRMRDHGIHKRYSPFHHAQKR